MKKTVSFLSVLLVAVLLLNGCTAKKYVTVEQTLKNADIYLEKIQKAAEQYGYEVEKTSHSHSDADSCYVHMRIVISPEEEITVAVVNSAYNSEKGLEGFSVDYVINGDSEQQFDTQLFADVVNCVSGKAISADLCDEFLSAPESEYPAEKYGYERINGELIAKIHPLNFFEDWTMVYLMAKDGSEKLSFGGLT